MVIGARRAVGGLVAGMTAVLVLTACGSNSADTPASAGEGSPAASEHAGHSPAAIPAAAPLKAGERFETLTMSQPYTPAAPNGGTDEYRCFLVDPKLTGPAYLTGSQFMPQNSDVVHHAMFYRIDPAGVAKARSADAASQGEGWTCFGDEAIGRDAGWVAHWTPGMGENVWAPGTGIEMPAGSLIVMQVHYNLLATGGKGAADQSAIQLRLADGTKKLKPLEIEVANAPIELPCAAGETGPLCDRKASIADVTQRFGEDVGAREDQLVEECTNGVPVPGNTQQCDQPVRKAGAIYALTGHMHMLGRSIKVELNPGTPAAKTLLDVPVYNFDDQAVLQLAKPVPVKTGDTLRVTCTHDAGLRKLVPQLRTLPPRYVVWGDGTSDEMCVGMVIMSPAG
ncbi:hypothetical protein Acsp02_13590 [Actinoplanes sp. NBRC 103695]|nr:hypothetical protein Acsp02_13590 [Actinoplanes sp. NBRC 103695]